MFDHAVSMWYMGHWNWCQQDKWMIDLVLKAVHFLYYSPAKRKHYITITGTDVFQLPFCGCRWLEDKKFEGRALQIWPHIITYVIEKIKKPKSMIPASSLLTTLRSVVHDGLITAKLDYFVSSAAIMKLASSDIPVRFFPPAFHHP